METKASKKEILRSFFPEDEFVLVIGTSHSAGACRTKNTTHIQVELTWPGLLEKKTGRKIVNIATPGNHNSIMVQQLLDVFDLGVMDRCSAVIVESRNGDGAGRLCSDTMMEEDLYSRFADKDTFDWPYLTDGRLFCQHINQIDAKPDKRSALGKLLIRYDHNADIQDGDIETILGFPFRDNVPSWVIKEYESNKENRLKFYHTSVHSLIDDLSAIRTMQTLCRTNGVKFGWFWWESTSFQTLSKNTRTWCINHFEMHSNIFDDLILKDPIVKIIDKKQYDQWRCELCRHINEDGHAHVADILWQPVWDKIK